MNDETNNDINETEPTEALLQLSPRKTFNEDENLAVLNSTAPDHDNFVEADRKKAFRVNGLVIEPNENSLRARLKAKYGKHEDLVAARNNQTKMIQSPKLLTKKSVTFNMAPKAENAEPKGTPKPATRADNLSRKVLSISQIPKWDGINVRSTDPEKARWIYNNAGRLGSKIPRLNSLKEKLL